MSSSKTGAYPYREESSLMVKSLVHEGEETAIYVQMCMYVRSCNVEVYLKQFKYLVNKLPSPNDDLVRFHEIISLSVY